MDLFERLEELLDDHRDIISEMAKLSISEFTSKKLFSYQEKHLLSLILSTKSNQVTLDGSETGTGKTYCASALCKELEYNPIVICPKSVIYSWKKVMKYFDVTPLLISNYEQFKSNKDNEYFNFNKKTKTYTWSLPPRSILIFDEAQRCKNKNTVNAKILLSAYQNKAKVLLLSASISDKVDNFEVFGNVLGLYKNLKQAKPWIRNIIREDARLYKPKYSTMHKKLFPYYGSRMSINEIGKNFPSNQIISECIYLPNKDTKEINKHYDTLLKKWNTEHNFKNILDLSIKMRMKLELSKAKNYIETIEDYLDNRYSVVVFVNFNETRKLLVDYFKTNSTVHGTQTSEEREKIINKFQDNTNKIIICNIKSGSTGLSLHDIHGNHPRISIIFPNFSSTDLVQSLGRIHRAGAKTPALQRIIFAADTCEEEMAEKLNEKLKFSQKFSNEYLLPFEIKLDG